MEERCDCVYRYRPCGCRFNDIRFVTNCLFTKNHVMYPYPKKFTTDVKEWIVENLKGRYAYDGCPETHKNMFSFELKEDALKFKMRWV